jgi:hypothetical protein
MHEWQFYLPAEVTKTKGQIPFSEENCRLDSQLSTFHQTRDFINVFT